MQPAQLTSSPQKKTACRFFPELWPTSPAILFIRENGVSAILHMRIADKCQTIKAYFPFTKSRLWTCCCAAPNRAVAAKKVNFLSGECETYGPAPRCRGQR